MNFKGTVKQFAEKNGIEPGTSQQVLSFLCDKGFARVIGEAPKAENQRGRAAKIYEALDMAPIGKFDDDNIKPFVKADKDEAATPAPVKPTPKVLEDSDDEPDDNPRVSQVIVAPAPAVAPSNSINNSPETLERRRIAAETRELMAKSTASRLDQATAPVKA